MNQTYFRRKLLIEDLPFDIGGAQFMGVQDVNAELLSCSQGASFNDSCLCQFHLRVRFTIRVRVCTCGGEGCCSRQFVRCITVEVPRGYFQTSDFLRGNRMHFDMESFRMHAPRRTATLCMQLRMDAFARKNCNGVYGRNGRGRSNDCGYDYNRSDNDDCGCSNDRGRGDGCGYNNGCTYNDGCGYNNGCTYNDGRGYDDGCTYNDGRGYDDGCTYNDGCGHNDNCGCDNDCGCNDGCGESTCASAQRTCAGGVTLPYSVGTANCTTQIASGESRWQNNGFWYLTDGTRYTDTIHGRSNDTCTCRNRCWET